VSPALSLLGPAPNPTVRADLESVKKPLTSTLIQRFWSIEGYALHDDVRPFLSSLASHSSSLSPHPAVVSGSDEGVIKVLHSLGVTARPNLQGGIKEEEIWTTWAVEKEKKDEAFWVRMMERLNSTSSLSPVEPREVLVVGDELISSVLIRPSRLSALTCFPPTRDYLTPRKLGMHSLLLRRPADTSEHARSSYEDESGEEKDLEVVASLKEVMGWIMRR
jgi:hypothetical protein